MQQRIEKQGGWFSPRRYTHLDYPITFELANKLAGDPNMVKKHAFLPLLGFTDKQRTFRTDNSDLSIPVRKRPRKHSSKPREIKYASHADAAIFSYYSFKLKPLYEKFLQENGLSESIVGYRSGFGSNIDIAKSVFVEVALRQNVTVLAFDISDFFPSIDHWVLKNALMKILSVSSLSEDWFKVYRAITKYSWLELDEILRIEGLDRRNLPATLVKNITEAMKRYRGGNVLKVNKDSKGIPQGSPISAQFANISLLQFDLGIQKWAKDHGATYKRYSDDILILCEPSLEADAQSQIMKHASLHGKGLTINPNKTEISRFVMVNQTIETDQPLTYLGFTFDGQSVFVRQRTLSRYYRRMTYAVRTTLRAARKAGKPTDPYRRKLYDDFTHLGSKNFYQYGRRADKKFENSKIKYQLRKHFRILQRKINNHGR